MILLSLILTKLDLGVAGSGNKLELQAGGIGSKLEFCLRIVFSFILEAFAVLLQYMHQCN
ncbi:hypothetical protein KI387_042103, partial [Taxus chinensis]